MLARAIREGVAHDDHLVNPTIMPYEFYRSMSDEDLASIIIYLRSIPPIRNAAGFGLNRKNLPITIRLKSIETFFGVSALPTPRG